MRLVIYKTVIRYLKSQSVCVCMWSGPCVCGWCVFDDVRGKKKCSHTGQFFSSSRLKNQNILFYEGKKKSLGTLQWLGGFSLSQRPTFEWHLFSFPVIPSVTSKVIYLLTRQTTTKHTLPVYKQWGHFKNCSCHVQNKEKFDAYFKWPVESKSQCWVTEFKKLLVGAKSFSWVTEFKALLGRVMSHSWES